MDKYSQLKQLHTETLAPRSYTLLKSLMQDKSFKDFYLVGGTALSLFIGHRVSIDLDLFSPEEFPAVLAEQISAPKQIINIHNNSIEMIKSDTKLMFLYFAYPRYRDIIEIDGVRLADPIDIGLIKLLALQGRTTKKDIYDLYFIDKLVINLNKLLEIFEDFYPKNSFNSYSSIKTLFSIDENSPEPKLLQKVSWEEALKKVQNKLTVFIKNKIT